MRIRSVKTANEKQLADQLKYSDTSFDDTGQYQKSSYRSKQGAEPTQIHKYNNNSSMKDIILE